jgi:hypothetical protein
LDEPQVERNHQVDEPIQHSPFFWFDDLTVDLTISSTSGAQMDPYACLLDAMAGK